MPQFDFSTYSSQIFWFVICFAIFYYFVSAKILPRITKILEERRNNIQLNLKKSENLNKDLSKINADAQSLKDKSVLEYKAKIDKVKQDLKNDRENAILEMKKNIENINKNSKEEINKLLDSSKADFEKAILQISSTITKKITN